MAENERRSLKTNISDFILKGDLLPQGFHICNDNVGDVMESIKTVVADYPWIIERYLEEVKELMYSSEFLKWVSSYDFLRTAPPVDPTKKKIAHELNPENQDLYSRFLEIFYQFEDWFKFNNPSKEVLEELRKKGMLRGQVDESSDAIQKDKTSVEPDFTPISFLSFHDRVLGKNRIGIATARRDYEGSLGGGTPRNPPKIGGLINRKPK
jgi:hypothetical protein